MTAYTIIAPPFALGTTPAATSAGGLEQGADALWQAGLPDRLERFGVPFTRSTPAAVVEDAADPIASIAAANRVIADEVRRAIASERRPVICGGTCNLLPGVIAGLQQALPPDTRIGLLWLDAHGDFNTPRTTRSGMLGGMPVAVTAGLCHAAWRRGAGMTAPLPTDQILMVDVRNLDPEEEQLIRATDVTVARRDASGRIDQLRETVASFASRHDAVYLHIDADVLDIALQPNHPTAEPDGFSVEETLAVIEAAARTGTMVGLGLVSVDPTPPQGRTSVDSALELMVGGIARWQSVA